jgi:hypothetical protein
MHQCLVCNSSDSANTTLPSAYSIILIFLLGVIWILFVTFYIFVRFFLSAYFIYICNVSVNKCYCMYVCVWDIVLFHGYPN